MQKIYFYDNDTLYHVLRCSDEVFVHTETDGELLVGRGQSFWEAINDLKQYLK